MAKQIIYGDKARVSAKAGIDKLSEAVKATLGPKGWYVVLDKKFGPPIVTNDGVTIAKEIELEDVFENMGAQLVKEVSSKTNDVAGDGTTTACVLAQAMLSEGYRNITAGANAMHMRRGITKAVELVVEELKKMAKVINLSNKEKAREEIFNIANISANDPDLAKLITDAVVHVGRDGVVAVEEGKGFETTMEIVEGMQFDKGYASPLFITDPNRMEVILEDAYVLVTDKRVNTIPEIFEILKKIAETKKPFLLVADDIQGEALALLAVNKLQGRLPCVAVKAPGFGDRKKEILQDIASVSGAQVVSEELGTRLDKAELSMLGKAKKVVVKRESTILIDGAGKKKEIDARCAMIKKQIETATSDYDTEQLRQRLAKLTGGVAVMYVGGVTETEMKARRFKAEDAMNAAKAGVAEGIVVGGGVALLRASKILEGVKFKNMDEDIGRMIVLRVLKEPIRVIAENAGQDGGVVVQNVLNDMHLNYGFNAETNEYENLVNAGIVDPVKVTRAALENAASIAGLLLTTKVLVSDIPKKDGEKDEMGL